MKIIQFTVCFLLAMFLCGFGCSSSKPTPDPLAGWKPDFTSRPSDQVIEKDYQDYIQKLPPEDSKFVGPAQFFEDGTGQHAVEIEVFEKNKNASWQHILFYDKENKRIDVIKYDHRKYQS